MKGQDLSTVFVIKKMFSTKVLLGDSYTVGRYCEMCEEIKNDIPFYSAMVLVAAQNHTSSCMRILLKNGMPLFVCLSVCFCRC